MGSKREAMSLMDILSLQAAICRDPACSYGHYPYSAFLKEASSMGKEQHCRKWLSETCPCRKGWKASAFLQWSESWPDSRLLRPKGGPSPRSHLTHNVSGVQGS